MLNGGVEFGFTSDDFVQGENWIVLRKLARQALDEAEVEMWLVPEKISFGVYIEIVDNFSVWRDLDGGR